MKAKKTWVVIADGARARIAVHQGPGRELKPALDHEFAAPHPPTGQFVSDRPGRHADASGSATHGVEPRTDRHDLEKTLFIKDIAQVIDKAAEDRKFDRLVLVAPPAALGQLRAALKPRTRDMVEAEIAKDLTHLSLKEVSPHLADTLPR